MEPWKVPAMWAGSRCWILGGGPSVPRLFGVPDEIRLKVMRRELPPRSFSEYLEPIHGEHVIGINNAYQIGIWIDVVFFGDGSWYLVHRKKLSEWPGLKVTAAKRFANRKKSDAEGIKFLPRNSSHKKGISPNRKRVSWNNNSGAAAISLAAHLGVKQIVLLGFDMSIEKKTKLSHWHGSHGKPWEKLRKPPFHRHMLSFPIIAKDAKKAGIEILNASPASEIKCFPKVHPMELL